MIRFILTAVSVIMATLVVSAPVAAADSPDHLYYQTSIDQFAVESGLRPANWVYVDTLTVVKTGCGLVSSAEALMFCPPDNAAYIGDDISAWMAEFHPLAPEIFKAHEWGHSLQHDAGSLALVEASENGADCVAGAWLAWANQKGHVSVSILDLPGLYAMVDMAKKQGEHDIHGTLADRGLAMIGGFTGGLDYCGSRYMPIR